MRPAILKLLAWLAGMLAVAALAFMVGLKDLAAALETVGPKTVLGWLCLTLAARLLLAEITALPVRVLGYRLTRLDAFWIGWLRTFYNQLLPMSGVAVFAGLIRRRAGLSWSELASLGSPQFLLLAAALGLVGMAGFVAGQDHLGAAAWPGVIMLAGATTLSLAAANGAGAVLGMLPGVLRARAEAAADAFRRLAGRRGLLTRLTLLHVATILLRGSRLLLLFAVLGASLDWQSALLLLALTEATALVMLTPGGLGIREGAVTAAALLVGLPAETGAVVALLDRIFMWAATAVFAAAGTLLLARSRAEGQGDGA